MGSFALVYPYWLWAFLVLPMLLAMLVYTEQARHRALLNLSNPALIGQLVQRLSVARRWIKHVFWLISVGLLIFALSRPTWGIRTDLVETQGVSVFVLLDVSDSMLATDVLPSRLERAKLDIRDLFAGIEGNEVGLIVFAGEAFVVFPLTTDVQSAQTFLDYVSPEVISRQGTALETALELALDSFNESLATTKVMVVFSDGEDHTDVGERAVNIARESGTVIHTLGYGTLEGSSIPIRDASGRVVGNKQDRTGNLVITRIESAFLEFTSNQTGGLYQRVDGSDRVIDNVVRAINQDEGHYLGEDEKVRGVERFGIFVALALLFLSLDWLLPETKD